jgi:hypothetical protein
MRLKQSMAAALAAATLAVALVPAPAGAAPVTFATVPRSGWSTNGIGRAVLVVGDTVYVGGSFSQAVPPSGSSAARANVAAFDLTTGALRTSFVANTNGQVRALASDGINLFLGGDFTTVNGASRARLAAVDLATGAVDTGFRADASSTVLNLDVYNLRLYAVGYFTWLSGTQRNRVGAVRTNSGVIDTAFNPGANGAVKAVVVSADGSRVYVGGMFTQVAGVNRAYLAALDRTSGAVTGPAFGSLSYEVLDLDVAPDGSRVFGAVAGYGNQAASWNTTSGARQWYQVAEGDTQAIRYAAGNVYFGFHEGFQGNWSLRMRAADAVTGALVNFAPTIDSFYGVWDIDASDTHLAIAGEFRWVAGRYSRGVAVFPPSNTPPPQTLVAAGSTWRYRDDGTDQGTAWRNGGFNDSSWSTGAAQLGYGDGDEQTVVSYGPNASNKYITTYFRRTFSVANPAALSNVELRLLRDDGAVVYLNGVEVARSNMPSGAIAYTTRAGGATGDENAYNSYPIDPSRFVAGTNTLAIEVHQVDPTSSDISFDLSLTG